MKKVACLVGAFVCLKAGNEILTLIALCMAGLWVLFYLMSQKGY